MKKILMLVLVCIMALSMVACGSSNVYVDPAKVGTLEQEFKIEDAGEYDAFVSELTTLAGLPEDSS